MNEFFYALIRSNRISFQSGNFLAFGFPNNSMTTTNMATLLHILNDKWGNSTNEILKQVGRNQLKAFAHSLFRQAKLSSDQVLELLRYLELFGYGSIQITGTLQSKEVIFQIKNSSLCLMKKKLFPSFCYENAFMVGICSGIAELLFLTMADGEEIACVCDGKDSCLIKVKKKAYAQAKILGSFDFSAFEKCGGRKLSTAQAELIKKVSGHYMIDWNEGLFTLWGCSLFMIPTVSFVFLVKALEERGGNEIHYLLYHLARVQSRESVHFQLEKMGFARDISLLKSILEHSDMTGFGMVRLLEADFDRKILSIEQFHNPYPYCMREFFGQSPTSEDHYVGGLLAGAAEGFYGAAVENTESKCVAKGDECCVHVSTKRNDQVNYPLEPRYLALIEEKICAKNFIL